MAELKQKESITRDQAKSMLMDVLFMNEFKPKLVPYSDKKYIMYLNGIEDQFHAFWAGCAEAPLFDKIVQRFGYPGRPYMSQEEVLRLINSSHQFGRFKRKHHED